MLFPGFLTKKNIYILTSGIVDRKQGNWSKNGVDNCEYVTWKRNCAFLQSFLYYSKSFGLQNEH